MATVMDGVKIGIGIFIVLPLLIVGIILIFPAFLTILSSREGILLFILFIILFIIGVKSINKEAKKHNK